jgi:hypothetical protein
MRTHRPILLASLLAALTPAAFAAPKLTSTWAAPDLAPAAGSKWLVLAQVTEEVIKRSLEDAVVAELKKKKLDAIPAYASLSQADLASPDALRARAEELGVDAGIVFKSMGVDSKVEATPSVSVGVGLGGYGGGMFGGFIGASKPIGGGTKTVHTAAVKVESYTIDAEGPRWIGTYAVQLGEDVQRDAKELASATVKQLKKVKAID